MSSLTISRLQLPLPGFAPASDWRPPLELPQLQGRSIKRIALDTETRDPQLNELGPGSHRGGQVVGIALGVEDDPTTGTGPRWYLPIRHREGDNLDERQVLRWARSEINTYEGDVVGTKLLYDLEMLGVDGIKLSPKVKLRDVQLAEPLLDENADEYNLDALAMRYLGEGKQEELLLQASTAYGVGRTQALVKGNLWQLPARYVGLYGEADVDRPLRIMRKQEPLLEAQGLTDLFDLECRLIPLLLAMRQRGVRVDLERARLVRQQLLARVGLELAKVKTHAGPRATLDSSELLGAALDRRNIPVPVTAKTGAWSVTKGLLERHLDDELARAIFEGRKHQTVLRTFVDGAVLGHHIDGRVYCQFHQLKGDDDGTLARFSSSTPCLQNIPARDEILGPLMRSIFVPEPGERWWRFDYSQIEYRLLAHFALGPGSDEARRRYNEDPKTDYHKFVAEMLGVDPEDKVKRKRVKNTNFAKGYGALAPKLATTFGCSIEEAEEFVREYEEKLPFAKTTFDAADRRARDRGFVRTILGRYGRFPFWVPGGKGGKKMRPLPRDEAVKEYGSWLVRANTYMALNRVLQGSAADLMKKAMVDIWESGVCDVLGAPLLTVHDELDWSAPETPAALESLAESKRIMETTMKLHVPIIAEQESGPNWGEAK